MFLDPSQKLVLDVAMGERADGSWAASEVGLIEARQNGKNVDVEVRELFGLTILNEWIIHTSHLFPTTRESYARLLALIEANPDVKNTLIYAVASPAVGYEMRFRGGGRIRFIARTRSSGRGLTGDLLIFDEAQELSDDQQGALLPTISARPGAQSWYLGSAPNETSMVFHRVRRRGRDGSDPRLAYLEFSADPDADLDDRDAWAQANPALGIRITEEAIETERGSMSDEMFACERLSISPDLEGSVLAAAWAKVCDRSATADAGMFAFDVNPERNAAAIVAVGPGLVVEVIEYRSGTAWLVERCVELKDKYRLKFAVDKTGPAGSFIDELKRKKVRVVELGADDVKRACGAFYDSVLVAAVRVRTNPDLDRAVTGAVRRPSGDAWVWGRKPSKVDISLLYAATVGAWAYAARKGNPQVISMADALAKLEGEK